MMENKSSINNSGLKLQWWKWLSILLVFYTIIAGFLIDVPRLPILHESIRNLFFHVTMWFAMLIMMFASLKHGITYLRNGKIDDDIKAEKCVQSGIFLGILGILTGSVWAKFTWGAWWVNDAKLNGAAATMLVYLAYIILRGSMEDEHKRARISAVYSIFAFTLMIVFVMILLDLLIPFIQATEEIPALALMILTAECELCSTLQSLAGHYS